MINYRNDLEDNLNSLSIPTCLVHCHDVNCKEKSHQDACDEYILDLLRSIEKAANAQIPLTYNKAGNIDKKTIPGWNDDIRLYKENAFLARNLAVGYGHQRGNEFHRAFICSNVEKNNGEIIA